MASCTELQQKVKEAEQERDAVTRQFAAKIAELKKLMGQPPNIDNLSPSDKQKYNDIMTLLENLRKAVEDAERAVIEARNLFDKDLNTCAVPPPCPNEGYIRPVINIIVEPQDRDTTDLEEEKRKLLEDIGALQQEKTKLESCLNNPNISTNSDPNDDIPDGTPTIPGNSFNGLPWADAAKSLEEARARLTNGCYSDEEFREIEKILKNIKCFEGYKIKDYKLKGNFARSLFGTVSSSLARIFNRIKRIEFLIEQKQLRIREIDYDIAEYRDRTHTDNQKITKALRERYNQLAAKCCDSNELKMKFATSVTAMAGPGAPSGQGGVTNDIPSSDTSMITRNGNTFTLNATIDGVAKILGKNGGDCKDSDAYWLPPATVTTTITISQEAYDEIIKCIGKLEGRPPPTISPGSGNGATITLTDCIAAE